MHSSTLVRTFFYGALLLSSPLAVLARQAKITVDAGKILNRISPDMYGSCIEDVNHEIYGGLYDQRLFGESFEEPAPPALIKGWTTLGGDWQPIGRDGLHVNSGEGHKLIREVPMSGDAAVTVEIKFGKYEVNAGLLVHVGDAQPGADNFSGYEISLDPGRQVLVLGKHQKNWQMLKEEKVSFNPADWNTLKVANQGPRLLIYVNNSAVPLIDYTDLHDPLPGTKIGLRNYNAEASFRNLVIQDGGQVTKAVFSASPRLEVSSVWDPVNPLSTSMFQLDTLNAFNGKQSQVIQHQGRTGRTGIANLGLNRWGISVRKGQKFAGSLYLRSDQTGLPVTVQLQSADGSKIYATREINGINLQWRKYDFSLSSTAADPKSRFVISIRQKGKLWIDQAVLMSTGADQFKGLPLRADIAKKMQEQGLRFLRYGGTMVNSPEYRWKNMKGDGNLRPPYKGHWYPYSSNGFGINEFVDFCEAAGFEPAFAINIEETAEDAVDLVKHFKGRVRYIEIGNEEVIFDGPASWSAGYDHYIERFNLLYEAIHAEDPSIKLINAAWWRPELPDMEKVFRALNGKAAYWDLHTDADQANSGTAVDINLSNMEGLFHKWDPNTTMKCTIFEENGGLHNMQRALGHATTLNATRRHGDFLLTSCPANALQALGQNDNGWDQGQIFFTPDQVWGMPPFYAQQMAAKNHMPLRVMDTTAGSLDVTATRSEDGRILVVHVVNTGKQRVNTGINLLNFSGRKPQVKTYTLAGELSDENTEQDPKRIRTNTETKSIDPGNSTYTFLPYSYTILRFEK